LNFIQHHQITVAPERRLYCLKHSFTSQTTWIFSNTATRN